MTEVLNWRTAADPHGVVRAAVRALQEGRLVAFPTETVYGVAASALIPEAVDRLRHGKGRPNEKPLALAIRGPSEALDWVPGMSRLGQRLARRCWPGPLTLVFPVNGDHGQQAVEKEGRQEVTAAAPLPSHPGSVHARLVAGRTRELPESVRQQVCPGGTLGLRVPDHDAILETLEQLPGPLVLTSANRSGQPAATTASEVTQALGDDVDVVIDDGRCRYAQASTVVQVQGDTWRVLREGVLSPEDLKRQAARLIVFVCTGNTCRSPMAEGLCKKMLAERQGCAIDELPARGFVVMSAGLAAMMGEPAADEAVRVAAEWGADVAGHRSRPLTANLVLAADHLIAMTQAQVLAMAARFPDLGPRLRLLSPAGEDVADPIGCEQPVYRECAQQIAGALEQLLPELEL
jgi:protein-tyrosine phosphatase